MDLVTYAVLLKLIKGHASGINDIQYNPTTKCFDYIMTDGTVISVPVPDGALTEEDVKSTVNCGAVSIGDIVPRDTNITELTKKLLVKDLAPQITITSTIDNTINYERGVAISPSLTIKVDKIQVTDGDINKVTLTSTPADTGFDMVDNSPNSTTNTYTKATTISKTVEYSVTATNTKDRTGNKKFKYTFVNPTYYGVLAETFDETNTTETDIKSGTKGLLDWEKSPKFKPSLTANKEKFFICYEASLGELTSIKDTVNGFELISGCVKFNVDITTVDGTVVPYYCYIAGTRGTYEDMPIEFSL